MFPKFVYHKSELIDGVQKKVWVANEQDFKALSPVWNLEPYDISEASEDPSVGLSPDPSQIDSSVPEEEPVKKSRKKKSDE